MVTRALLVRLRAQDGKKPEVEEFLRSAQPLVQDEPATLAWFAVHFGGSEYGIFDAFPDDVGREAHLAGAVAKALMERFADLFAEPPQIQKLEVLAHKLPKAPVSNPDTKALLLTLKPKSGHEDLVEQFLRDAQPWVEAEPDTTAWFAIREDNGRSGIFDTFPNHEGRLQHVTGRVARELAKHALSLLGGLPDPDLLDVLAEKLVSATSVGAV
jgi:quinol monooxygenase YgiN